MTKDFRTLSENDVKTILDLRKEGISRRKVSKQYNVSEGTLYLIENGKAYKDVLEKLGLKHEPIAERGNVKRQNRKLKDEDIIEIFNLTNSGVKTKYIQDKFKISYTLLNNIFNNRAYNDIIEKYELKKIK